MHCSQAAAGVQGKPVSKRQEAMIQAKAQKLAQQSAPQGSGSPELSAGVRPQIVCCCLQRHWPACQPSHDKTR